MKIRWLGHAAFFITTGEGTRIVTDPFDPEAYGDSLTYPEIEEPADIVAVSHSHPDHNWSEGIGGNPVVVSTADGYEGGVTVWGIKTFLSGKLQVKKMAEADITAGNLPQPTEIWVLERP